MNSPNSRSGGKNYNGGIIVGGRDPIDIESCSHSRSQLNNIPFLKPTQKLRRGTGDALDQELELPSSGGEGGGRGDGEEGGFGKVREAELEVLTGGGVRGNEVGRVGNIDGDVEKGVGGGEDGGERSRGPKSGVLAQGSSDGSETTSFQVTKDRHGIVAVGIWEAKVGSWGDRGVGE